MSVKVTVPPAQPQLDDCLAAGRARCTAPSAAVVGAGAGCSTLGGWTRTSWNSLRQDTLSWVRDMHGHAPQPGGLTTSSQQRGSGRLWQAGRRTRDEG